MLVEKSPLAPMLTKLMQQSSFSEEETQALLSLPYRLERLQRGDFIVQEGDQVTQCCSLLSGFVHRNKISGAGARQILSIHILGDVIDLQNSIVSIADHNVQALTDVDVAFIPRQAIEDIAARYPKIGRAFWKETVIDASIAREWLLNIGHRNAYQRISHLMCELALRQEAAGICTLPDYEWPMTQEQVGDAMGLTPVHVNRTMQKLRAQHLLRIEFRTIKILDWPALQSAGDFSAGYLHLADSRS